jgi:aldose 1-epimerase
MASIVKEPFGRHDGKDVDLYTLTSDDGAKVKISTYGGIVTSWTAPDREGKHADIVLGFNDLAGYTSPEYLATGPYFGAVIGRFGNRIGWAGFRLDGVEHGLDANEGGNTVHGGQKGFDKRVWDGTGEAVGDRARLALEYVSADGEERFPGELSARVVYTLRSGGVLEVEYSATTDRPTVVNLTQHTYFNLKGEGSGDILATELELNAGRFTPIDENLITTGELRDVAGTPFDFRRPTAIGARVDQADEQLAYGHGYDHNFVIDRGSEPGLVLAARAYDPGRGRVLEVHTTEPGVQFYSGNHLDGTFTGKSGKPYGCRVGFCLETQHFPDSPNKPEFPSVVLRPGETYRTTTVFKLSVR